MPLGGPTFAATFTFARPVEGMVRDAAGAPIIAAVNVPRFDHDEAGGKIGLLVEPGPHLGGQDRVRVVAGDWEQEGPATVLHFFAGPDDVERRNAVYTMAPRATMDALLAAAGHHRLIGIVPGYLRNLGGYVRFRGANWYLPVPVAVEGEAGAPILEDGDGRLVIEG